MRPLAFDYVAPESLEDALRALAEGGEDAAVISGGQSLLPVLRMRLGAPSVLVDLRRIDALREVRLDGDTLVIGARATYRQVAGDALVSEHAALLGQAAGSIGDPQIRARGTVGGSLAHADPAGDLAPAVLALDGSVELTGPGGARLVPAGEFLVDHFVTAREADEIVTAVHIPSHAGWGQHYEKFTVVAQAWSVVAVGAAVRVEGGTVAEARIAMAGMGSTALRAAAAEESVTGTSVSDAAALKAAVANAGEGTHPAEDGAGNADYRRHLAGVLAGRAVVAAVGEG